jgi:ribosome-associated translation inhibitor RaiA
METISFVLGMASVVVIAIAIVAVYAFVKVRKHQEEVNNLYRSISEVENNIHLRINSETASLYSAIDSRFDKLENKVNNKQLIKG